MRAFTISIRIFLFFLITTSLILSQEQTVTKPQEEKPLEPITYSLLEIPTKIEEVNLYYQTLNELLKTSSGIARIDSMRKSYLKIKEELVAETDLDKLDRYFIRKLEDLKQRWQKLDDKISDWETIVTNRTNKLEEEKNKVDGIIGIWDRTYENVKKEQAPKELTQNLNDILTKLKRYQIEMIGLITENLKRQNVLTDESIELATYISKLSDAVKYQRKQIFSQDSPPLWDLFAESGDTVAIATQFEGVWQLFERSTADFVESNRRNLALDFVLLVIALLFVFGLKFFSKNLDKSDESVSRALKILERPISITVLLFMLFLVLAHPEIPPVLKSLMAIIILIPLLRIILHITDRLLHLSLIGFTILFALIEFQIYSINDSVLERILSLMTSLLAIAGISFIIWEKILQQAFEGKKATNQIIFGIRVAAVLVITSLLLNILGYVRLSALLVKGTFFSVFAIILFVTGYLAVIAILVIFLQTKAANRLKAIQNHPEKIKYTTSKIIRFGATIWLIIGILNNFEIKEVILEWLIGSLTKKWEIGTFSLSIGDVLLFFITIWIAILFSRLVRFFLAEDILSRMTLPRGVPGAISAIIKYVIVGFGIIVAFTAAGLSLDKFSILIGALGVGIGFGLQELVNNFVSGLILIFERPIQVGDAVQVDTLSGRVTQIGIRSSIIKTWQGAEVIVPNGQLIASKLVNWTMSDQLRRIEIPVGVKYGSEVERVMEVLLNCAKEHSQILVNPAPYVLFNEFADSYLGFELRCWTSNYNDWISIRSEILVAIDKIFKKEGIQIPFPQRDLHIITDLTKSKESQVVQSAEKRIKKGSKKSLLNIESKAGNKEEKKIPDT